jgi:hypothetical protein
MRLKKTGTMKCALPYGAMPCCWIKLDFTRSMSVCCNPQKVRSFWCMDTVSCWMRFQRMRPKKGTWP